jgi:hypothetical protein
MQRMRLLPKFALVAMVFVVPLLLVLSNQALGRMDEVTQRNAVLVEHAAAAAESLQDQAIKLSQAVAVFKLDGERTQAANTFASPVSATGTNCQRRELR